ncbi:MAG: hypothetical protein HQL22_07985 [Candidatus Omnitrophica bacterium]|nr:hypothetical protein [Candidatus Omnitrophota bacterium]
MVRHHDLEAKDKFLAAYLALVADISRQQHDLLWWATDVSSKNRFQTPLPQALQSLIETGEVREDKRKTGLLLLRVLRHAFRSAWRAWRARMVLGDLPSKRLKPGGQYVIRSFVYDGSFTPGGLYRDPFFGDLSAFLKKSMAVVVAADVQGDYEKALVRMKACQETNVFPWEYYLSFLDILQFSWRMLMWRPLFKGPAFFMGKEVTAVLEKILGTCGRKIQPPQLFHYPAFLRLAREIKVERFLLTYESNPWEKMCILAMRQGAPGAKIYGYQHNVIPPASANMFLSPKEAGITPMPDKIITAGEEPRRILERNGAYPPGVLKTGCALRMAHLSREPFSRGKGRKVLVALEGVDGVKHLVRYIFDQLKDEKGVEVVFRTHPVLPWCYFKDHYGYDLQKIPHFRVSAGTSLIDDINHADVVVYWGTTVSMEALVLGRPVIHFDNGSWLSFDPLFNCRHLKWDIKPQEDLKPLLDKVFSISDNDFALAFSAARGYLKEYFYPVSDQAMVEFR